MKIIKYLRENIRKMLVDYSSKKKARTILLELILLILLLIILKNRLVNLYINISYQFQREYRDGAIIDIANEFKNLQNPFTFDRGLPHTYTYGLMPPLITGMVGRITNFSLQDIQHVSSCLLIMLTSLIIGLFSWKNTKNLIISISALLIPLLFNSVGLRPEVYAIFLTVLGLSLVQNDDKKSALWVSLGVLSILLYYIKPYFVLLWAVLLFYLFLLKKPKNIIIPFIVSSISFALTSFF